MQKAIALVSGGIDSPVAALLASRKYDVLVLHFCLYPFYCTGTFKSILSTLKKLLEKGVHVKIIPWAEVLAKIAKSDKRYQCILCRKSMLKAAEIVAKRNGAKVIITGEAIGQKASQTLSNIAATSYNISIPILRPLAGLDKEDIIKISREVGLWSEKHASCCSIAPKNPVLHANKNYAEKLWSELRLEKMIISCLKKAIRPDRKKFQTPSNILKRLSIK